MVCHIQDQVLKLFVRKKPIISARRTYLAHDSQANEAKVSSVSKSASWIRFLTR
jgi:hypothetical protein